MKPLLIAIAIVLVAAPVALAAKFVGETTQERRAVVRTNADDEPVRITIRWRARCEEGHLSDDTTFLEPFRESTKTFVRDGGRYTTTVTDDRGREYDVEARARVRGRLVSETKWRGRFRLLSAEVRRNGELVTECSTRRIRWSATL